MAVLLTGSDKNIIALVERMGLDPNRVAGMTFEITPLIVISKIEYIVKREDLLFETLTKFAWSDTDKGGSE
jgi:hypothetical protein